MKSEGFSFLIFLVISILENQDILYIEGAKQCQVLSTGKHL